jgi:hypothetical protein
MTDIEAINLTVRTLTQSLEPSSITSHHLIPIGLCRRMGVSQRISSQLEMERLDLKRAMRSRFTTSGLSWTAASSTAAETGTTPSSLLLARVQLSR